MSRSVTAVAAYLIKYHNMDADSALGHIGRYHKIASPNQGFVRQLRRYAAKLAAQRRMDEEIEAEESSEGQAPMDTSNTSDNSDTASRSLAQSPTSSGISSSSSSTTPTTTNVDKATRPVISRPRIGVADPAALVARATAQRKDDIYCKKCRHLLFHRQDIIEHTPQQKSGQKKFSANKLRKDIQQVNARSFGTFCSSFFLDRMDWMGSMGDLEGSLQCPKCRAKVGTYKWVGAQCSCGQWITPALQVLKSKVDFHMDDSE